MPKDAKKNVTIFDLTPDSFSFCGLIFSHLQVQYFPFTTFFVIYFINKSRSILSLAMPCFMFNFNSRKSKQT